jgi:ABC-2 type transport system ATP-binding protein
MTAIRVDGLRKTFRQVRALDGLSFEVPSGTVFGFLGPNGAGKTTTLRILAGLARPDAGLAWVEGHPVGPDSPARKVLGYLPEEPHFYAWMTATEFLREFIARLFGLPPGVARERTAELLDLVGLKDAARRRIGGFSRGMRQRLGLAQALMNKPRVMLLDEPVSALDPAGRRDMLNLIETLRSQAAVLMSTHILDDVERVCDTIGIIDHGQMVALDNRQALLDRYATPSLLVDFRSDAASVAAWAETLCSIPGVKGATASEAGVQVRLGAVDGTDQRVLDLAVASGMPVEAFLHTRPTLEDVFLQLVGHGEEAQP